MLHFDVTVLYYDVSTLCLHNNITLGCHCVMPAQLHCVMMSLHYAYIIMLCNYGLLMKFHCVMM